MTMVTEDDGSTRRMKNEKWCFVTSYVILLFVFAVGEY